MTFDKNSAEGHWPTSAVTSNVSEEMTICDRASYLILHEACLIDPTHMQYISTSFPWDQPDCILPEHALFYSTKPFRPLSLSHIIYFTWIPVEFKLS